jgi:hypothetical protein
MDDAMDDRIALRLGALRLARRRGRTRDAAWAASRLRLAGVTLDPRDARFAREMRVKFGHALRIARIRGPRTNTPNLTMPLLVETRGSRRKRLVAALIAAALLLGAVLLYLRYQEAAGDPEGAPPAQVAIATPPPPLRGRSQPGAAAPVAIVEVTPVPTTVPVVSLAPAGTGTGTAGGGTGAGGSGGGTGTGNGKGTPTPTPTPSPTPTPTPAPTPTIDPSNHMHVHGRVVDAITRRGIQNVCYGPGIVSCQGAPVTDADGFWELDLTVSPSPGSPPSTWSIAFITPGYITGYDRFVGRRGDFPRPDVRLRVN